MRGERVEREEGERGEIKRRHRETRGEILIDSASERGGEDIPLRCYSSLLCSFIFSLLPSSHTRLLVSFSFSFLTPSHLLILILIRPYSGTFEARETLDSSRNSIRDSISRMTNMGGVWAGMNALMGTIKVRGTGEEAREQTEEQRREQIWRERCAPPLLFTLSFSRLLTLWPARL